mmetsp:Transcript_33715/g.62919  ORF Transcript_33715/g.62919 Transcript_33715/m.62919 type:complete len:308 (-) Transcript_33715:207-1130(-)
MACIIIICMLLCSSVNALTEQQKELADAAKREIESLQAEVTRLQKRKDFDTAIDMLNEAGPKMLKKYGPQSWPVSEVAMSLADVYAACDCGEAGEAAKLYEKAIKAKLAIHGERHPMHAAALERAGDGLTRAGKHKHALRYYKTLVAQVSAGLGQNHEASRKTRVKLGDCALQAKKYQTAATAYMQVLANRMPVEEQISARMQLSVAQAKAGNLKSALEHAQKACDLSEEHFGKKHMKHAQALNSLAGVLERSGQDEAAARAMEDAATIAAQTYGEGNAMVIEAQRNLNGLRNKIIAKQDQLSTRRS